MFPASTHSPKGLPTLETRRLWGGGFFSCRVVSPSASVAPPRVSRMLGPNPPPAPCLAGGAVCGDPPAPRHRDLPLAVARGAVALTGLGEGVLGVLDEAGVARELVVTRRLGLRHCLPRPAHLHRNVLLRDSFCLAGVPLALLRFIVERIGGGDAEALADGLASGRAAVRSNSRPLESATVAAQADRCCTHWPA